MASRVNRQQPLQHIGSGAANQYALAPPAPGAPAGGTRAWPRRGCARSRSALQRDHVKLPGSRAFASSASRAGDRVSLPASNQLLPTAPWRFHVPRVALALSSQKTSERPARRRSCRSRPASGRRAVIGEKPAPPAEASRNWTRARAQIKHATKGVAGGAAARTAARRDALGPRRMAAASATGRDAGRKRRLVRRGGRQWRRERGTQQYLQMLSQDSRDRPQRLR